MGYVETITCKVRNIETTVILQGEGVSGTYAILADGSRLNVPSQMVKKGDILEITVKVKEDS